MPGGLRSALLHFGPSHNLLRPATHNLYLAGPSPCPCPGVDTPPDINCLTLALKMPLAQGEEEFGSVVAEFFFEKGVKLRLVRVKALAYGGEI